jgi:twitching motility protein PilT
MYSAIQTGGQLGMQTLDQCLRELLDKSIISKEAAQEKAKMPDDFM